MDILDYSKKKNSGPNVIIINRHRKVNKPKGKEMRDYVVKINQTIIDKS